MPIGEGAGTGAGIGKDDAVSDEAKGSLTGVDIKGSGFGAFAGGSIVPSTRAPQALQKRASSEFKCAQIRQGDVLILGVGGNGNEIGTGAGGA